MKKNFLWIFAVIFTVCSTMPVLTACGDDDDEDVLESVNIVGRWRAVTSVSPALAEGVNLNMFDEIEFKSDGTVVSADEDGQDVTGTWRLADRVLTMTFDIDGGPFTNTYRILDGWTRDRIVMTYNFNLDYFNADGKSTNYVVTITMRRAR